MIGDEQKEVNVHDRKLRVSERTYQAFMQGRGWYKSPEEEGDEEASSISALIKYVAFFGGVIGFIFALLFFGITTYQVTEIA